MNSFLKTVMITLALAALLPLSDASAQGTMPPGMKMAHGKPAPKMVAYDAKDKRFYSVAYAKSHGMHDKGGDPLTIVPLSSLPKEAKESKTMHGTKI